MTMGRESLPDARSAWKDRRKFNDRRKAVRDSLSLALDRLAIAGGTDDPDEAADAMADVDAHLAAARDAVEASFRDGIADAD